MKKLIITLFVLTLFGGHVQAQLAGELDTTFNANDPGNLSGFGFNALIASMHSYADGSALVGGHFTKFETETANRIAKVKADGTLDKSFNAGAGANSWVTAIAVQSDGKIVIGGLFTNFDNKAHTRIARLNTDGSIDTSFHTGSGFNDRVTHIRIQADGKIVIGGWFNQYNGATANKITRLNSDGTLDTGYNSNTLGTNNNVYAMDMQADGKILIGGFFTQVGSTSINRFARLNTNGTVDTSFHMPSGGFNWVVQSILAQQDGNILVIGAFATYGSTSVKGMARLSSNGTLDAAFNANVTTGFNQAVHDIIQLADKSYIAGGYFTKYNGVTVQKACRIDSNGVIDANYKPYVSGQQVYAIGVQPTTGKVMLAGEYGFIDDYRRGAISRMNADGSVDFTYNTLMGLSNPADALMWMPNGKILVGGSFSTYNGKVSPHLVMIDSATGKMDTSFKSLGLTLSNTVNKLGLQSDGKILVGGWMSTYGDSVARNFFRLDVHGNKEPGFPKGTGFNSTVQNFVIQPDGKIICVGNFTTYNGASAKYIIRINADGTPDASFNTGTGFNNGVYEIQLQSDGKVLVAGLFTSYNGTAANRLIRLNSNGSIDNGFLTNIGTGFNNNITSEMLLEPNGKIIVAGSFSTFNGSSTNRIVRLNSDGTRDTSFSIGSGPNNTVADIIRMPNGKFMVWGNFTSYAGTPIRYLARINNNGSLDNSFNPGTSFNTGNSSSPLLEYPDGRLLVVSSTATSYQGTGRNYIFRIFGEKVCNLSASASTVKNASCYDSKDGEVMVTSSGGFGSVSYSWNDPSASKTDTVKGLPAGNYTVTATDSIGCMTGALVTVAAPDTVKINLTGENCFTGAPLNVSLAPQPDSVIFSKGGNVLSTVSSFNYGTSLTTIAGSSLGNSLDKFRYPYDLVFAPNGDMYVSDGGNHRVMKYAPGATSGTVVAGGNGQGNSLNKFHSNWGIALDAAGNIYVCDHFNQRVMKYAPGATSGTVFISTNNPSDIVITPKGEIYVSSNTEIRKYSATGASIAQVSSSGAACIAVHNDTVFASEPGKSRVVKFAPGSTNPVVVAGVTSSGGNAANQLFDQRGVIIDGNGNLIVANGGTRGLKMWPAGSKGGDNGTTLPGTAGNLNVPYGLTLNPAGDLVIADYNHHRIKTLTGPIASYTPTEAGTYVAKFINQTGCTATDTFTVNPAASAIVTLDSNISCHGLTNGGLSASDTTGTAPHSYAWAGRSDTVNSLNNLAQGSYTVTITDANGCSDTASGSIVEPAEIKNTISDTACNSYSSPSGKYTWTTDGQYLDTLTSATGCDSILTINLIVNNSSTATISDTACDSYTSPSGLHTWTATGTYMDTLTNAVNCDSILTINLVIKNSTTHTITDTSCNSYSSPSGNHTWTTSGQYMDTLTNAAGCDSIITVNLTINNSSSNTITDTACNSYTSPSGLYTWTSSGQYLDTLTNSVNCDSIITVNLTINNSTTQTITDTACNSYTSPSGLYAWTTSGTYMDTLTNAVNCDSILTINLTINNSTTNSISATTCDSYTSPSGNFVWTTTGTYMDTLTNAANCDSILTINLTVNYQTTSTLNDTACNSYTSPSGKIFTTSGTHMDTIPNANNCDSVITINLVVNYTSTATVTGTACDNYVSPSGLYTWNQTGTYRDTLTNAVGCDSIVTINLTIFYSSKSTIAPVVCDSYTSPSGMHTWTTSGTYQDTILNAHGCDSIMTINLTINNRTYDTLNWVSCNEYTSPSGTYTWNTSGSYQDTLVGANAVGCDSVLTIHLTINYTTFDTIHPVACDSYTSPSGKTFTATGTYTDTIPNVSNCDSTITINLTVNHSTSATLMDTACFEYTSPSGNSTWNMSGTYQDTIPNAMGCDSVLTIDLVIQTVDTMVTQDVHSLIANASNINSTYMWLDCEDNFSALNDTTQRFTPTSNGTYAVQITTNGCVDTSNCYAVTNVGWKEVPSTFNWSAYPNPTNGLVTLEFGQGVENITVVIRNTTGQIIHREYFESLNQTELELSGESGMYLIEIIREDGNRALMRVMKQD
ncbi:T9SS type A sorting domain-containing protein [bacterium SCSIO 12741]|nr:T9SS type A sorting domain-containing protein [bacterium SCSIO 12741]